VSPPFNTTRIHTDAIIATLEDVEISTGDAIGKDDTGGNLIPPYAVVYPMPGELMGTLDDPDSDAELVSQVTYVGETREQTEWLRDKGRAALLAGFDVEGRVITRVTVDTVGEVRRDDATKPKTLFYCPERYRIWSTPGPEGS
jgi:hypothetical protein